MAGRFFIIWATREAPCALVNIKWIFILNTHCYLSGLLCSCICWAHIYKADIAIGHLHQFSSVTQLRPSLYNPWTAACQDSLSFTNSWSLLKLMSMESVMTSNHLILCRPLLLPPSIFPSIKQGLFKWVSSSHQVAKVLELQHQSFQWLFRTDIL